MFEQVPCLRRQTTLIEQFGLDELRQPLLQRRLLHRRDRLEHLIGKLPP